MKRCECDRTAKMNFSSALNEFDALGWRNDTKWNFSKKYYYFLAKKIVTLFQKQENSIKLLILFKMCCMF